MKEMTIEQKAQAYDDAKARMSKAYNSNRCTIGFMNEIFPELRESEDERIRKAIHIYLDWLDGRKDYAPRGEYTIRDMIAWLEKQSTPQVRTGLEWVNTIDDACDKRYAEEYAHGEYCHEQSFKWGFQEGVDWLEKQGESTDINPSEFDLRLNKLLKQFETLPKEELASSLSFYLNVVQNDGTYKDEEKQGEQNPADKLEDEEYNGEDYGIDSLFHAQRILEKTLGKVDGYQTDDGILSHQCAISAVKKLYKRKPTEWSEDDVRNIDVIDTVLFYDKDLPEDTCVRLRNWLESLRDRVQPKQEWSEEDERMYKSIIYSFDHNYPLLIQQQEFIKSLIFQKQWKPTKAQLTSLTIACDRNDRVGFDLTQLLKELKKL